MFLSNQMNNSWQRFDSLMDALRDILEESGLTFKKLDKRLERTMLHSYRKVCSLASWTPQQGSENWHEPVGSL